MAKRMTDTDKWKKPFLRRMEAPYKLLWLYLLDECDHAGIWHVDLDVAELRIGEKLSEEKALKIFEGKIQVFDGGEKWYIPDFVFFQYGDLKPENRVHKSVLDIHQKYKIKGLVSPSKGVKEKDMDKDKEQDKDMNPLSIFLIKNCPTVLKLKVQPTLEQFESLEKQYGEKMVTDCFLAMENYKPLTQNYQSVYLTANKWLSKEKKTNGKIVKHGEKMNDL